MNTAYTPTEVRQLDLETSALRSNVRSGRLKYAGNLFGILMLVAVFAAMVWFELR